MKHAIRTIGWVLAAVLLAGTSPAGDSDAVDSALKQVKKAIKGVRGVVAEVEYAEIIGKQPINGSGKLYVDFDGKVRAEIAGDTPLTMLFLPPYLYIHREAEQVVEIYDVTFNPHMLGQYLLLGFAPSAKEMKKEFKVELAPDATLDGSPTLHFVIVPKSKEAARAIARIELWVDPESGLPAQHRIYHAAGETQLMIRYVSMSRDDELPAALFKPVWPEGTQIVRK